MERSPTAHLGARQPPEARLQQSSGALVNQPFHPHHSPTSQIVSTRQNGPTIRDLQYGTPSSISPQSAPSRACAAASCCIRCTETGSPSVATGLVCRGPHPCGIAASIIEIHARASVLCRVGHTRDVTVRRRVFTIYCDARLTSGAVLRLTNLGILSWDDLTSVKIRPNAWLASSLPWTRARPTAHSMSWAQKPPPGSAVARLLGDRAGGERNSRRTICDIAFPHSHSGQGLCAL